MDVHDHFENIQASLPARATIKAVLTAVFVFSLWCAMFGPHLFGLSGFLVLAFMLNKILPSNVYHQPTIWLYIGLIHRLKWTLLGVIVLVFFLVLPEYISTFGYFWCNFDLLLFASRYTCLFGITAICIGHLGHFSIFDSPVFKQWLFVAQVTAATASALLWIFIESQKVTLTIASYVWFFLFWSIFMDIAIVIYKCLQTQEDEIAAKLSNNTGKHQPKCLSDFDTMPWAMRPEIRVDESAVGRVYIFLVTMVFSKYMELINIEHIKYY